MGERYLYLIPYLMGAGLLYRTPRVINSVTFSQNVKVAQEGRGGSPSRSSEDERMSGARKKTTIILTTTTRTVKYIGHGSRLGGPAPMTTAH